MSARTWPPASFSCLWTRRRRRRSSRLVVPAMARGRRCQPGARTLWRRTTSGAMSMRAADGDGAAYERLYRHHVVRIHSLARRMMGPADAEEMTQEVFVRAWTKLRGFRGESAFGTWLHRLAVNLILERREARNLRQNRPRAQRGRVCPSHQSVHRYLLRSVARGQHPAAGRTALDAAVTISAHVRHRRDPRAGRAGVARGRAADGRGAAPPRARRRGRAQDRAAHAGPHPAGHHRRGGRRPAARLRGRPGHGRSSTARSTTTVELRAELEAARPPLRHRLGLRGGGARLRGARARLRARAERHLRASRSGTRASSGWWRRATQFGVKPLYWCERRPPHWRWPPRSARCSQAGPGRARSSTAWRSTTTWPAASCPRRARCSRASASCPPRRLLIADRGRARRA